MNDAPAPVARIVGGPPRKSEPIVLKWPLEFDGRSYSEVVIRRVSAAEINAFVDEMNRGEDAHLPIFEDVRGAPMPRAVLDAMDQDDADALTEAAQEWLPLSFRGDPTRQSPSETAVGSSPSSAHG